MGRLLKPATTPPTPLNDAPQGGFFLPKVPFQKPVLALDEQVALLEKRGLLVPDKAQARLYLENISYYRFSGYTRYFARPDDPKRQLFRDDISFQDVVNLYVFDRRLRVLMAEAFERIEVAVKGSLAYHGAMIAGPFWMSDPANFDVGKHGKIARLLDEACEMSDGKHKQLFLEAFFKKYSDPVPPAWMLTEVVSFHGASMIYKLARGSIRQPIAEQFGVQHDVLASWLHALVFARNVCAHHMRFWNRRFTIWAQIPKGYRAAWPDASRDRLYIRCCIVHHLLQRLGGDTTWHQRLRDLINARPNVPLANMGFPDDWEAQRFWGFAD